MFRNFNVWFLSSLLVSIIVSIPILTVLTSFFEDTSNYYEILKDTFLFEYVSNSFILLFFVLIFTFLIGTTSAEVVPIKKVKINTKNNKIKELETYSNKKVSFKIS